MDKQDNPIEGFVRRPKKPPQIILPDIIEISDEDSGAEPFIPKNHNLVPVVKREATENETTGSEILIPDDIDTGKKKKKKKKKISERIEREIKEAMKKLKRKLKKEHVSDSDSDSSNSSLSSSSDSGSDSDSDSSENGRRKRTHNRSNKSRRDGRKTKRRRSSKRLKREKETTDETMRSDIPSSPDNSNLLISSKNGQNNSNQVPNGNSSFADDEAGTSFQNNCWHPNSQYNSSIPGLPTQLVTVSTTMTANDNGHGTPTLDQIVPLIRYDDDQDMAGTSQMSPEDMSEIRKLIAELEDNTTQLSDPISSNIENSSEQQFIENSIPIVHGSELVHDQNDLPQLNSLNESDTEQQVEQLPEINVERSGARPSINLQRPRPNTDKMLYLTNPERANVCVFCYDSYTNIVNHYKRKHGSEEVYVSRISPKMANRLKADDFARFEAKCEKRGSFWKLHAKCFFCEYPRAFNLSYWIDHIRIHTGEYARLCTSCGTKVPSHGHCGVASEIVREHNLTTYDLNCLVCKHCNFVQIELRNMERHLFNQHGFQPTEFKDNYDTRMLLPSKNTVCKGRAAVTAQGTNSITTNNQQENASNIRVLSEVILNPFNNGTPEPNAPVSNTPEPNTLEPDEPNHLGPKREDGWDQRTYQRYTRISDDDNKIVVNPWLETKTRKKNIFPANLFDFYKCMHPNCIFSTNEKIDMRHHVNDHYAHIDIGLREKHSIDIHKKSYNCPYCYLTSFRSVNDLFEHMESIHSSCTYQCSHCYYRCIEMDSIVMHYKEFHMNEVKNVYIVNSERKFGGEQMDRIFDGEYVYTKQFHEFMCCYCNDFESSQVDDMKKHLAKHHSSEFMFVLTHAEKDEYIYVGEMLDWKNYKFFKCGKYRAMSKYLDWDQQNIFDQPDPFPLVPVLEADFELQIAEDVRESMFVYRKYAAYRNSQTVLFRCGRYTPEYLIANLKEEGSICRICSKFMELDEKLPHFKEHQKTCCYFTADREDLILQHMQKKHNNDTTFFYRKLEREGTVWKMGSMKCSFACGICANQKFPCFRTAREHHKTTHPNDVETIQIERFLNGKKESNETFSFIAYKFCVEPPNNIDVYRKECKLPMTSEKLKAHHELYHTHNQQQRQEQEEEERNKKKILKYRKKLVLCKNNTIIAHHQNEEIPTTS